MKIFTLAVLIGLLSLFIGCKLSDSTGSTKAEIQANTRHSTESLTADLIGGTIASIHQTDTQRSEKGIIGSILIERDIEKETYLDKISARITDKTKIFEQKGQDRHSVKFEQLEIGQNVQVQFTGPFLESYPIKATASVIVIMH